MDYLLILWILQLIRGVYWRIFRLCMRRIQVDFYKCNLNILGFYRFCIPAQINETLTKYYQSVSGYMASLNVLTEAVEDVRKTTVFILCSALIAMAIGFIWMIVMKTCAACLTWTTIILFVLSCFGMTYYLYTSGTKR